MTEKYRNKLIDALKQALPKYVVEYKHYDDGMYTIIEGTPDNTWVTVWCDHVPNTGGDNIPPYPRPKFRLV